MILPQVATIRNDIVLQAEKERREKAAKQERRELAERQDLERRRRDAEGFERSLRKKLSVGDLLTMHKEGRSYSDETILQVLELNKDESGNLQSATSKHYLPHLSAITTFFYGVIESIPRKKLQFKPLHKNYIFSKTRR